MHRGKPFFAGMIEFITSGPLVALAVDHSKLKGYPAVACWQWVFDGVTAALVAGAICIGGGEATALVVEAL